MMKKFRRYLYSFWRNSRTWQTDRHRVPAIAALMHSITRQKALSRSCNQPGWGQGRKKQKCGKPTYLSLVLIPHQPQWSLRSVNQNLLHVLCRNSSFRQRSFSYCAPKVWNDVSLSVRQSPSLDSFKRNLTTHVLLANYVLLSTRTWTAIRYMMTAHGV